jgi:hypothetical protein
MGAHGGGVLATESCPVVWRHEEGINKDVACHFWKVAKSCVIPGAPGLLLFTQVNVLNELVSHSSCAHFPPGMGRPAIELQSIAIQVDSA